MSIKTWKNHPRKLLIIGPVFFSLLLTKSQFLFHKNCSPRDLFIKTLNLLVNYKEIKILCNQIKTFSTVWFLSFFSCLQKVICSPLIFSSMNNPMCLFSWFWPVQRSGRIIYCYGPFLFFLWNCTQWVETDFEWVSLFLLSL